VPSEAAAEAAPPTEADASEPLYCLCNRVSYGNMVACDNPECLIEWFHYQCVGLTEQPKGKWYCPACAAAKPSKAGPKKGGRAKGKG
jgi:inhibitor of growth protein 4